VGVRGDRQELGDGRHSLPLEEWISASRSFSTICSGVHRFRAMEMPHLLIQPSLPENPDSNWTSPWGHVISGRIGVMLGTASAVLLERHTVSLRDHSLMVHKSVAMSIPLGDDDLPPVYASTLAQYLATFR
jgi:hypothetical protein